MVYLHFRIGRKEENKENGLEGALSGRAGWGWPVRWWEEEGVMEKATLVVVRWGEMKSKSGGEKVQRKGPNEKANIQKIKERTKDRNSSAILIGAQSVDLVLCHMMHTSVALKLIQTRCKLHVLSHSRPPSTEHAKCTFYPTH